MKPAPFAYHAPRSLPEALELLGRLGGDAKLLAGGQSLVPVLNFRLARPAALIDVNRLGELDFLEPTAEGGLRIGALARQRRLEREPAVTARAPLLAAAVPHIAHPQIRNRGTVGGSLAHADPAAELPCLAVALDARLRLEGAGGSRWVSAREFFLGLFTTALAEDELLTEVELPPWPEGAGWSFLEVARRHGDYAQVGVAARLILDNGRIREARLVYLSVGDGPVEAPRAAALLAGEAPGAEAFAAAAAKAAGEEIDPSGDIHATADFKRHLARVLTVRALTEAAARAHAEAAVRTMRPGDAARAPAAPSGAGTRTRRAGAAVGTPAGTPPGPLLGTPPGSVTSSHAGGRDAATAARVSLTVNGRAATAEAEPRLLLSDFLRHELGLTGTHVGCEHGVCGACTVLLDGEAVRSCLMFAVQADGHEVTTVEGLAPGPNEINALHPLQQAFWDTHGLQCGFCTPGFLLTLVPFLAENPDPSEEEIRHALSGNLCRCTGYQNIVAAARLAAARLRERGERGERRAPE